MTTVAVMGSMVFSGLDSPSVGCPESTSPDTGESVVNLMRRSADPVGKITALVEAGHRVRC